MIRDQGTLYMERELANERAEASLDTALRFAPAAPTDAEFLRDNGPHLIAVCEAVLAHWTEETDGPQYDEETGEQVREPLVVPHELAVRLSNATHAAKGYRP